jgi:hypothetical protein
LPLFPVRQQNWSKHNAQNFTIHLSSTKKSQSKIMMNSPRANNSNSNKSSNEIERKLQRVEADFRRQREEARRAAELAAERLRLAQEDAASRRKTVDDLQVKLQHVHVDKDSRTKFYELTVSVEMSTKEVGISLAREGATLNIEWHSRQMTKLGIFSQILSPETLGAFPTCRICPKTRKGWCLSA